MAQINKKMQDEMNHYVKFMMEVAERNIPKRLADKNKVKSDAIESLRNKNVNDIALIDGNTNGAVTQLEHTNVSIENKELMALFQNQKEKGWGVTESKLGQKADVKFATELQIQEAGFQAKQLDIQEGLRLLLKEEIETMKDIVANFWDGPYFLKVTSGPKPPWYQAPEGQQGNIWWYQPQVVNGMVINPLTDILTGDYFIKVDISHSLRPNKERQKAELVEFIRLLAELTPILQAQGKIVSLEAIMKAAKEFGLNPDTLLADVQLPVGGQTAPV